MKKLFISGLHIEGSGVRLLNTQKVDNFVKSGLITVNGQSGVGKTTLLEVLQLVVQGKDTIRDANLLSDDAEETEIKVPIAEFDNPAKKFYIRAVVKRGGDVRYTFQLESENGKLKATDHPLEGMDKLTVSKLQDMMNTSLTYGIDDFLSEDYTKVREFILKTFSDELMRLGLIVDKKDEGYSESIYGRIESALLDRDDAFRAASKLGANKKNLESENKPVKIDLSTFEIKRQELNQELADFKAEYKQKVNSKQQRIDTMTSEAENVRLKADALKMEITIVNKSITDAEERTIKEIEDWLFQADERICEFEKTNAFFLIDQNYPKWYKEIYENIKNAYNAQQESIVNRDPLPLIPTDSKDTPEIPLQGKSLELYNSLLALRKEYQDKVAEINEMKAQEDEQPLDTSVIDAKLADLELQIKEAEESNYLLERFDAMEAHEKADDLVKELYMERNRLFLQINCGIKGLSILNLDDEGKRLGFFYDGVMDKDYFQNPNQEPRPLTSYSKSQKIYIAAMLQCYLMSKKAFPLNVLCVDDTGMDARIRKLWNTFASKYGLMILVTSTNDRTVGDLEPNEILIEGGEIIVKE